MNIAQIIQHSAELWILVGLIGSGLEAIGEAKKWPKLVAFGQRLEAASIDLPKLIRGSRKTAADKAAADNKQDPPSDKTPPTGTLRTLALLSVMALVACAGLPKENPPCDQATLSAIIAECALRVEVDCAGAGIPESECPVLKECDARLEKRTADCR